MAAITRKEARAQVFNLLFETEFHTDATPEEIYALSQENREFVEDAYIRRAYFGVQEHLEEIDEIMARHANGWKPSRITPISRSAIRLCIFEMKYMDDIRAKEDKVFDDPSLMRTPIVRNGKQVTIGYCPEVWDTWE